MYAQSASDLYFITSYCAFATHLEFLGNWDHQGTDTAALNQTRNLDKAFLCPWVRMAF